LHRSLERNPKSIGVQGPADTRFEMQQPFAASALALMDLRPRSQLLVRHRHGAARLAWFEIPERSDVGQRQQHEWIPVSE